MFKFPIIADFEAFCSLGFARRLYRLPGIMFVTLYYRIETSYWFLILVGLKSDTISRKNQNFDEPNCPEVNI